MNKFRPDRLRPSRKTDLIGLGIWAGMAVLAAAFDYGVGAIANANYGTDDATKYLQQAGYTNVVHTDTDKFLVQLNGCGKGDFVKHEFMATGPTGVAGPVDVCSGLLSKGATIRQG
jgi:hypothetical protein